MLANGVADGCSFVFPVKFELRDLFSDLCCSGLIEFSGLGGGIA